MSSLPSTIKTKVITKITISDYVDILANMIKNDLISNSKKHKDSSDICIVPVLKGATFFANDLIKALGRMCSPPGPSISFISVSSYKEGNKKEHVSAEDVVLLPNKEEFVSSVLHKDVVIVDTIVDTGNTMNVVKNAIINNTSFDNPVSSISTCALIYKDYINANLTYAGTEQSKNGFYVGYGLDYNEKFRCLPDIYEFDLNLAKKRESS